MPRSEYPRPDLDRSAAWLSLNGEWAFEADGVEESTIVVPFAWETEASGVRRPWLSRATYHRTVTVPADWAGRRPHLCFGAVHHHARVLVDGAVVVEHVGGHTSFEADLTDVVTPGASFRLSVEVKAPVDKREIPHGKQRSVPRDDYDGVSFTPTSGIWQSVWLEARGPSYAARVVADGTSLTGFDVSLEVDGDPAARVLVEVEDQRVELTGEGRERRGRVELAAPRLWAPGDPQLYALRVVTTDPGGGVDDVTVTAGLRSITAAGEALYLNGRRLYLRGVLDQGYWPGTGLTAPSAEALVADLELAQRLGFNLVRKHIKLEEPIWLHEADRLGILVWAEPPGPSRFSPAAAEAFEAQLAPMVERDRNHPSIVVWGLYNEEWGLDWDIPGDPAKAAAAGAAYDAVRALDPTRLAVDNSGWAHVRTDLVDWHYYDESPAAWAENLAALADGRREDFPVRLGPDYLVHKALYADASHPREGVPVLNSEYGAGFTSLERGWHLRWQTQELRRHDRFAGYVYTELTDVEHEMAGVVDVDRRPKDLGGLDPAWVHATTVLVPDLVPLAAGADVEVPTAPFSLAVRVSHHGTEPTKGRLCAAWAAYGSPTGAASQPQAEVETGKVEPFRLSDPTVLVVPEPGGPARLHLWLVGEDDAVLARTHVDAAPVEEPNRP
jgi:beta-galactosidase/beta-glucuronidase